ncbi:facilitated trehalose transporter Tret1-2 homolog [Orussus abietinus]|uniref:facilitated trehalose transporter Tret1-2 homolog n=1 Tax=Orussus abietinus TaxID=222816 RepID=UPI00062554EF|nr:facilitated trehalose transporter Tret1-2 homolog [Orussus abietinus]
MEVYRDVADSRSASSIPSAADAGPEGRNVARAAEPPTESKNPEDRRPPKMATTRAMLDHNGHPSQPDQPGRKLFQGLATLSVGLVAMQAGMKLGWTSPTLPYLASEESFLGGLSEDEASWISSLMPLGAVVGAVPAGKVADRIGRKASIGATAIPFLASWTTLLLASNVGAIYAARFMGGLGAGAACVLVPVYIGEIAEPSIRGALGACFPLLFSTGIVLSYAIGGYASYVTFNLCCVLSLVPFLASLPLLPESPMWLVHQGLKPEASRALELLRGLSYDTKREIAELQAEADELENKRGGIRDLAGTRAGRRAIIACLGLMWFQQMSGVDAILFYTVDIFRNAESTVDPVLATVIVGLIEVVMTLVVAAVIDRFGRKPLLTASGACMAVCLGALGYYFKLQADGVDVRPLGWMPLVCVSLFNVVFSLGYGAVPFTVISELFPPETKGIATSASIMLHWTLVFAVTKLFPATIGLLGEGITFWGFSGLTALSALFAFFVVPETKGKSLREIQMKLHRKKGRDKAPTLPMDPA